MTIQRTSYLRVMSPTLIVRAWGLICEAGAVSVTLHVYTDRMRDTCADIGIHTFCLDGEVDEDDQYPHRCDYSPTGYCQPGISSLAGVRFIEELGTSPDDRHVWEWLQPWLVERFHVEEEP